MVVCPLQAVSFMGEREIEREVQTVYFVVNVHWLFLRGYVEHGKRMFLKGLLARLPLVIQ